MKNNPRCKDCMYCKCYGRTDGKYSSNWTSRRLYACNHPKAYDCTDNSFVGYGDTTASSPLQLKTSKKWCPLKNKES